MTPPEAASLAKGVAELVKAERDERLEATKAVVEAITGTIVDGIKGLAGVLARRPF